MARLYIALFLASFFRYFQSATVDIFTDLDSFFSGSTVFHVGSCAV